MKKFLSVPDLNEKNLKLSFRNFLSILIGLTGVFFAIYFFHLEENLKLVTLAGIVLGGYIFYVISPPVFRLPLLFLINVTAIFILTGWTEGFILLLFALVLFALLNLRLSVRIRTILLIAAAIVFALARINWIPFPHGSFVIPILGGLFMFRSILFLYEQRFIKKQVSIWLRLNYFFLLPNLVFVIFPVVDYKTFINNYYSKPSFETSRKGVLWMANGILHLFAYRLIYYYFIPNPAYINDVFDYLQFIVGTYALIVRLAGIFHFSAGVICLFGFDLPPTFRHYFFADGFNDLWRRINIYWRDFVMKVIYYPIYFKVKHWGTVTGIAISILITFAVNWGLHAYQWFWIRGSFLFTIQDLTFWGIFGIAVLINSVFLANRQPLKRSKNIFSFALSMQLSLRVIGIFIFMCFLYSWWTANSISEWIDMLNVWKKIAVSDVVNLLGLVLTLVTAGIVIQYFRFLNLRKSGEGHSPHFIYVASLAVLWLMVLGGTPAVSSKMEQYFQMNLQPVLYTKLNDADRESQFNGYYENILTGQSLLATPLDELGNKKPEDWKQLHTLDVLIRTNDLMVKKLKPNVDITFKGARFQTNNLGLRDREVELKRPEHTLRWALLGGSIEMGTGVTTEETFENLVEDRLTNESLFNNYHRVEIVNFATPGIHLPQQIARIESIVPSFNPQVIMYAAHTDEIRRIMENLYRVFQDKVYTKHEYLISLFESLNLADNVDEAAFKNALQPKMIEVYTWGLNFILKESEKMGAVPIWMFVPALEGMEEMYSNTLAVEEAQLFKIALDLGFFTLDLRNFNEGFSEKDIILRAWDRHPNVLGHQLIAKKMIEEIQKNKLLLKRIGELSKSDK